jgi:4-nitrophenyl phosphatase
MSLNSIKNVLIDMDGVLWRGDEPLPGLTDFFATLFNQQIGFMLLTNNSTRAIPDYVEKLGRFNVDIQPDQVMTSSYDTADWLADQVQPGARVYAVGEAGLHSALTDVGFQVSLDEAPDEAEAVVVGLYLGIDIASIHHAARLVRQGALFVGTNPDVTFPFEGGLGPGAGSILAAVTAAAGKEPTVIGKPNPLMYEQALKRLGATPEQTTMIGDRLDTDILGGQRAGVKTALVLTGVTQAEDLNGSKVQPTWVFDSIVALTAALNGNE